MKICDLAQGLGLSRQMIGKLKKQGMPVSSLEEAISWRKANIDPFRSKLGRIGGNSGLKRGAVQKQENSTDMIIRKAITEALTNVVPNLWFSQIGWLGSALRDHGVKMDAEALIKVQATLFLVYMNEIDEYLETENTFTLPESLKTRPGDQNYTLLVELLNIMLAKKPKQLYEA